ncbi:two-component regulator propeller domain-containing protein [Candidatus Latescibacterota bacterium]
MPVAASCSALAALALMVTALPAAARNGVEIEKPALARVSFWLHPDRFEAFEAAYDTDVVNLLLEHGLTPSDRVGRRTVQGVFSRLLEVPDPGGFYRARLDLFQDPRWQEVVARLDSGHAADLPETQAWYTLNLYDTPAGTGEAVRAGPGFRQGLWRSFAAQDGLPSVPFSGGMIQDRMGRIWFATSAGLVRFDGVEFVTFTHADGLSSYSARVFEDRDGRLWLPNRLGVTRYDGRRFTHFGTEDGLPPVVRLVWQDKEGRLWFATGGELCLYDDERFSTLPITNIEHMAVDGSGDWWLGGPEPGLWRYDGHEIRRYTPADGAPDASVSSIVATRDGGVWIGTWDGGAARFIEDTFETFTQADGLPSDWVLDVLEGRDGHVWLATGNAATRYDGHRFTTYGREHGFDGMSIQGLHKDRDGNVWFLSFPDGVVRYDGLGFELFTTADGLANGQVLRVLEDREGTLWFGTWTGLSRYDGSQFSSYTTAQGLADNGAMALHEDSRGNLWVGTWDGISSFDGSRMVSVEASRGRNVWSVTEGPHGAIWFGAAFGGGASRYDGEHVVVMEDDDGAGNHVAVIHRDTQGDIWLGTELRRQGMWQGVSQFSNEQLVRRLEVRGGVRAIHEYEDGQMWFGGPAGLFRLTPDGEAAEPVPDFPHRAPITALRQDHVGNVWIATEGGLQRFDGTGFTAITTEDGLPDDRVQCVLQDDRGTMWFGTGGGVCRYDGLVYQQVSRQDGLIHDLVQDIAQSSDGSFWIATEGGVTRYRPSTVPPRVQLVDVIADSAYGPSPEVRVPSSQRLISFEFEGGSWTTAPDRMAYVYRLLGHDDDWRFTRDRRVTYSELPVGEYTFEVKAVDRDLNYSTDAATAFLRIYHQPVTSSYRLAAVRVQDVYASFYKTYAERSIGSVQVINDDPNPVQATVSFYIPEVMSRPTEREIELDGGSSRRVEMHAVLDEDLLDLEGSRPIEAEVSLVCDVGEQTISIRKKVSVMLHGRGALTWDTLGRAAAFITPEDHSVSTFTRSLPESFRSHLGRRRVDGNLPTAMLLFEALSHHGIRYVQDANSPYSRVRADRAAVDHIQYPTELLRNRMGDCDDCTVLYCALLENLSIPTALVDAPDHIFMAFDSGIDVERQGLGFAIPEGRYIRRDGRLWIPVEVTVLGEGTFMEAWDLGARTSARLQAAGGLRLTEVSEAWQDYKYALPPASEQVEPPTGEGLARSFLGALDGLATARERYIESRYVRPLLENPDDLALRLEYGLSQFESADYNGAISTAAPLLGTAHDAEAAYLIGSAYVGKKDLVMAVTYMERAVAGAPENWGYARSLEVVRGRLEE